MKEKNKIMNKTKKNKILKRTSLVLGAVFALTITQVSTVFGADDPLTVINNLSTFIFGIIRAIGMILYGKIIYDSIVLTEQIRAIDKTRLTEKIDYLRYDIMKEIDKKLLIALGIKKENITE